MTIKPLSLAAATILSLAGAAEPPASTIRVDQAGYETHGPKTATVATPDAAPRAWALLDGTGTPLAQGKTIPFGVDSSSAETVQRIDFSGVTRVGSGYRLAIGDVRSQPFPIADRPFAAAASAAMSFFYQQRSGVPIVARYVQRPDLARPAGHPSESVTCFAGKDQRGVSWPGCGYRLDTTGGWYDAGDQGKYVVNGGIATWTLLDLHERLAAWGDADAFADGRLMLPENGNGRDDLLDEAKVEVAFLLAMQIPDGQRLKVAFRTDTGAPASDFRTIDAGGLVHTKVADVAWTGLPMAPADDPMPRFLYPPSTAATYNMVAVAAQAARIWRTSDPAFAARALAAARRGWAAAQRVPDLYASSDFTGSGGYGDSSLSDEFYWAAAELYATTGEEAFRKAVTGSPHFGEAVRAPGWSFTAPLGTITLATVKTGLGDAQVQKLRATLIAAADGILEQRRQNGYAIPYRPLGYPWGSNGDLMNQAMLLGVASDLTGAPKYRAGIVSALDYLLGRNPMGTSYVSGYGARSLQNPHHRFWAHSLDARLPGPPPGVLSGGPNDTAMGDQVAMQLKGKCVAQTCWADSIHAYALNEVAINWNAPLFWVAAWMDD